MAEKGKEGAVNLFNNVVDTIKEIPGKMLEIGKNIVEGLWNGIKNAGGWIKDKIGQFSDGIVDGMKSAMGIHSPSKLFRDEVGKYIALGVGEGFTDNIKAVYRQMKDTVDFQTQRLSTNITTSAIVKASKDDAKTTNYDNSNEINVTQQFYTKNATAYEQQTEARQQFRRLLYGI